MVAVLVQQHLKKHSKLKLSGNWRFLQFRIFCIMFFISEKTPEYVDSLTRYAR